MTLLFYTFLDHTHNNYIYPATVRSVGTGQDGEVELRRQTPIQSTQYYDISS